MSTFFFKGSVFNNDFQYSDSELWVSDGTALGTQQLTEFRFPTGSLPAYAGLDPRELTLVNNTLFFVGDNRAGFDGLQIWKSDGTAAGTVEVTSLQAGFGVTGIGMDPADLVDVNGVLYFIGITTANGGSQQLWKSDGTSAGTVQVTSSTDGLKNILGNIPLVDVGGTLFFNAQGTADNTVQLWKWSSSSGAVQLTNGTSPFDAQNPLVVNGTLYFTAENSAGAAQLWKSDGSAAGTVQITNIANGITGLTHVGNQLYYMNSTDHHVWVSDGTAAGSVQLPIAADANTTILGAAGSYLYGYEATFGAFIVDHLWKTDGTVAGTTEITLPVEITGGINNSTPPFVDINGTEFFDGFDNTNQNGQLWKTDGTLAGTMALTNVAGGFDIYSMVNIDGELYFEIQTRGGGGTHWQFWKSDGTVAGTMQVLELGPQAVFSDFVAASASTAPSLPPIFWVANDGVHGNELWESDGSAAGTMLVSDINPGSGSSFPNSLTAVGNTLFFVADNGSGQDQLWKTAGVNTSLVTNSVGAVSNLTKVGSTLYFTGDDGVHGTELWKSDGTAAGTVMVKDIVPGSASSDAFSLTDFNGTLYFSATDGVHGIDLWKSDGTAAGTVMVAAPGGAGGVNFLTVVGNTLYFTANDDVHGYELWKSDGTTAGTAMVADIVPGNGSSFPEDLTAVGDTLFFVAHDSNGDQLWKSDGTGATMVSHVVPPVGYAPDVTNLINVDGTLFFSANSADAGQELWKSDGTAAGTVMVKDIAPGIFNSNPGNFFAIDHTLYFTANDGVHGFELWKSDGTAAGTVMVKDITPGSDSTPNISGMTDVGGELYFEAGDAKTQLWKTDGTAAGTVMVTDVYAGAPTYTTKTWTKAADGSFDDASKWSGHTVPGATNDVAINKAGAYTITESGTDTIHSLTIKDAGPILDITGTLEATGDTRNSSSIVSGSGGDLKLDGNVINSSTGGIDADGGDVSFTGTVRNAGSIEADDGKVTFNAGLTNQQGGTVTAASSGEVDVFGLAKGGSIHLSGSGATVDLEGATTNSNTAVVFDANATGVLELNNSAHFKGTVTGFGAGDSFDFKDINYSITRGSATRLTYVDDGTGHAGTLTLRDAAGDITKIAMEGHYTAANFHMVDDGPNHHVQLDFIV